MIPGPFWFASNLSKLVCMTESCIAATLLQMGPKIQRGRAAQGYLVFRLSSGFCNTHRPIDGRSRSCFVSDSFSFVCGHQQPNSTWRHRRMCFPAGMRAEGKPCLSMQNVIFLSLA